MEYFSTFPESNQDQNHQPTSSDIEDRQLSSTEASETSQTTAANDELANLRGYAHTDRGNAERLIRAHGENLLYANEWQSWMQWQDSHWSRATLGEITQLAHATVDQMYLDAAAGDPRDRQERLAWAHKSEARARLSAMVGLAQSLPGVEVRVDQFDRDPMLFNVLNVTIDLNRVAAQDQERSNLITKVAPVHFDAKATAPTWERFLRRIMGGDEAMVRYLQRIAGYLLTGLTVEHRLFLAYGEGANGKGTFLNTLAALMGPYAAEMPTKVLLTGNSSAKDYALATLPGVRFALASETPVWGKFDEPLVKAMTGGDTITARSPYEKPFQFLPQFKPFLMSNYLPGVKGLDEGIWRRMMLVPFGVTIPEHERDKHLGDKLRTELSGILNWCLEGLREWQRIGLAPPQATRDALQAWREESNPVADFLAENVVRHPESRVSVKALHAAYVASARAEGERHPLGKQQFNKEMDKLGYMRQKNGHGGADAWQGIRLRDQVISLAGMTGASLN